MANNIDEIAAGLSLETMRSQILPKSLTEKGMIYVRDTNGITTMEIFDNNNSKIIGVGADGFLTAMYPTGAMFEDKTIKSYDDTAVTGIRGKIAGLKDGYLEVATVKNHISGGIYVDWIKETDLGEIASYSFGLEKFNSDLFYSTTDTPLKFEGVKESTPSGDILYFTPEITNWTLLAKNAGMGKGVVNGTVQTEINYHQLIIDFKYLF